MKIADRFILVWNEFDSNPYTAEILIKSNCISLLFNVLCPLRFNYRPKPVSVRLSDKLSPNQLCNLSCQAIYRTVCYIVLGHIFSERLSSNFNEGQNLSISINRYKIYCAAVSLVGLLGMLVALHAGLLLRATQLKMTP